MRGRLILLVSVAVVATVGSAVPAATASTEPPLVAGDFYTVPEPLPAGEPGTLIKFEPLPENVTLGADNGTAYRIMYLSESVDGDPIAVTGTAIVPYADAPAGGRRIYTLAHGTRGVVDECAPSHDPRLSEMSLALRFVGAGYLLVMSDYEGLGTPGVHPYLVGVSEGRSVLDAAKAATQLPDADAGTQLAIGGMSQGGHGAIWASELAADWAPDLELVATFAGAPARMSLVRFDPERFSGFSLMVVGAYAETYPEADPSLVLTPDAEALLSTIEDGCVLDVLAATAEAGIAEPYQEDADAAQVWVDVFAANDTGQTGFDAPLLVWQSSEDTLVLPDSTTELVEQLCALGQEVEYQLVDGDDHDMSTIPAFGAAFEWIEARFAGAPIASAC